MGHFVLSNQRLTVMILQMEVAMNDMEFVPII